MNILPATKPLSPLPDAEAISRAYDELKQVGLALATSAEARAEQLDSLARAHVKRARQHTLALGPVLLIMRDHQLFSHLGYASFDEWLMQSEIDLKRSAATDIINLWKLAVPALEAAGVPAAELVDNVSLSKARLILRPIKQAADRGQPLASEDVADLVEMAKTLPYDALQRHIKPSGAHTPRDNDEWVAPETFRVEEEPYVRFRVVKLASGRYRVTGEFDEREMEWLNRRLRPVWLDEKTGEILTLQEEKEKK